MLYLASERKQNLQVLMICASSLTGRYAPAVRLRRALLNQSCWLDTVNDELASLFIIDGALLGKLSLVRGGAWRRLALGKRFLFFYYINRFRIMVILSFIITVAA